MVSLKIIFDSISLINVGCPKLVRCDRGTENVGVAYLQPFLRSGTDLHAGTASFRYGISVSNQVCDLHYKVTNIVIVLPKRIEQFWGTLRKWYTDWWIDLFKVLSYNIMIGIFNHSHCTMLL